MAAAAEQGVTKVDGVLMMIKKNILARCEMRMVGGLAHPQPSTMVWIETEGRSALEQGGCFLCGRVASQLCAVVDVASELRHCARPESPGPWDRETMGFPLLAGPGGGSRATSSC